MIIYNIIFTTELQHYKQVTLKLTDVEAKSSYFSSFNRLLYSLVQRKTKESDSAKLKKRDMRKSLLFSYFCTIILKNEVNIAVP